MYSYAKRKISKLREIQIFTSLKILSPEMSAKFATALELFFWKSFELPHPYALFLKKIHKNAKVKKVLKSKQEAHVPL